MSGSLYRYLIYPLMVCIPNWSSLNRMGRSRLLKTSYVWLFAVPVLAQLLIKVGPDVAISAWGSQITLTLQLPFSWKMFFYSSVAFAIASLIYSVRCPAFVRDCDTFSDFTNQGKGSRQVLDAFASLTWERMGKRETIHHILELNEFINDFLTDGEESHTRDRKFPACMTRLRTERIDAVRLPDAFWYVWNQLDESRPTYRATCAIFFALGFVLITAVAIQNLIFVIRLTF